MQGEQSAAFRRDVGNLTVFRMTGLQDTPLQRHDGLLLRGRPQFIVGAAEHGARIASARARDPHITKVAILRESVDIGAAESHFDAKLQFLAFSRNPMRLIARARKFGTRHRMRVDLPLQAIILRCVGGLVGVGGARSFKSLSYPCSAAPPPRFLHHSLTRIRKSFGNAGVAHAAEAVIILVTRQTEAVGVLTQICNAQIPVLFRGFAVTPVFL
jgi:hypothetical protein